MNTRTDAAVIGGRRVHFIGIGGCGTSGLARMMRSRGAFVTGSDGEASDVTRSLAADGIEVTVGPPAASVPDGTDLVVFSAAVQESNPQLAAARSAGIECINYAQALGAAQADRTAVSIAGTHGKSTTTALLSHVLIEAGLDPSVIVGAHCPQFGGGTRTGSERIPMGALAGEPGIFVAEACEFNRSFHAHRPTLALINNVEEDHLDCYASLDEIVKSFRAFAGLLPAADRGGKLLIAHEGAHRRAVASGLSCSVHTFGWSPSADFRVEFIPATNEGALYQQDACVVSWRGHLIGEHNALNAAAAAILASWLGASWRDIQRGLESFAGIDRRMQKIGECESPTGARFSVFDDYGHHPTECERTLAALRSAHDPRRLICVFQPHQHSRTRFLLEQFAQSFGRADLVIVPPIYFVRDSEIERTRVCSEDLVERLRARGTEAMAIDDFGAITDRIAADARDGDLVVVMGAGPVWKVAHELVRQHGAASQGAASQGAASRAAATCPPRAAASPTE